MKRAVLLAALVATMAASAASAKEGAQAHLLTPLASHPRPGSMISVRWSVDIPGTDGNREPFGAIGMFVRLLGRAGASTSATAQQHEPPYQVRVRVPAGGIRGIRFGLMGTSCGRSGCKPSPIFFPLR